MILKSSASLAGVLIVAGAYLQAARPAEMRSKTAASSAAVAQTAAPPAAPMALASVRTVLDQYCVTCHNERLRRGELVLENTDLDRIATDAALWEKVLQKLRGGTMPPLGAPRPDQTTYRSLRAAIETAIDQEAQLSPNPGRPLIHRLNRAEYTNAVRDLLSLEIDGSSLLPPDSSGFGFDNVADILSMSPVLVERYMAAARKISRAALGDPTLSADVQRYDISRLRRQEDRQSDTQPFGTRGGVTIRHHFPLDGEYVFKIDFQMSYYGRRIDVRGLHVDSQIDLRIDGERVKSFVVERKVSPGSLGGVTNSGEPVDSREVRVPVTAGTHEVVVAIAKGISTATEGYGPSRLPQGTITFWWHNVGSTEIGTIPLGLSFVEIHGPFNGSVPEDTPSRRSVLVCRPADGGDAGTCARTILSSLARRAYRRPVTDTEIETLLDFYEEGSGQAGFERGIQFALERILIAPQFLFRLEDDPADGGARRISDLELASRLSFFLWSSIPDDDLLDVAARGALSDPTVLEQQVQRMLADPKSKAMLTNFFGQWLWLRNMATVTPDPDIFPGFDDTLRLAFQRETELFLESQVHEDHSALDLLTANYTFVNERLARHYGIPNVYGSHFRRVALTNGVRAGLLGHGSVLTVTAYPNRTSPVVRGKWILDNLLGTPPPDPPPDVPQLEDDDKGDVPSSMRAKMELHRRNPVCSSCHSMLDPLGFALENFDAVGKYRATEGDGTPIDASGLFPSGAPFDGPADFRTILLEHRDAFLTTLTQKMLTYALGRGVEYSDMPAVRRVVRQAAASDYRWSSLVLGIVESTPFQMRGSRP